MKPIALISAPTLASRFPSFQLALLKPTLEQAGFAVESMSLFLRFAEHIGWELNEALADVYPCMVGEWIWAKAAFGDSSDTGEYLEEFGADLEHIARQAGGTVADIVAVRDHKTVSFIDWALREVDWSAYSLVGFSVCFQQMVASLALAKAIKAQHPDLPIIFGGATFEDDIAMEIMARNPEIDYLHCGDADASLPEVVSRIRSGEPMKGLRGMLWRDGDEVVFEGRAANFSDLDSAPTPDFDEYFHTRAATGYDRHPGHRRAMLPIETARGCWYGMKNHCTFCGLNRAGIEFRSMKPERVLVMLKELSSRYGVRDFNAIDNILAPAYISRLFGRLANAHTDLRLHYEIRPKLSRAQLGELRRGGLVSVQPGIESFATNVLTAMRKNITGMGNLELLKWTTYHGINNLYNILYGFRGETEQDYRSQAAVLRKIPHLQPPYAIARARPDRGSPMFEQPQEHDVSGLRPSRCYRYIYPPSYDLNRVSYFFEHDTVGGLPKETYGECIRLVGQWKRLWADEKNRPYLRMVKTWESVSIHDGRGDEYRGYRFDDDDAALYEMCTDARSFDELAAGLDRPVDWLQQALGRFLDLDLVISLDGKYLALALPANPYH
ncbi:ribosomal peptide maturation radical SAM protein 1 [Mycobacterium sp. OAS707]|uniref:RiPP maturation radical SAM C-methyltransferase n=1 Tax=Mycobacterium sp. OAS707 TaxID=2663822 RepID=UPI00178AFD2D|nr:ribosomal peptide maturation radical SAM protein 1 [Mycobacterium sp. OAS707]